ncbi:MAG: alpha/beta hydrolase family protein [Planctomycetota bacterium]
MTKRLAHLFLLSCALLILGCGGSNGPPSSIVAGVDLDLLFAEPTQAEIDTVLADWAGRDVSSQSVVEEASAARTVGMVDLTVRVVSHAVNGVRHFGAIVNPVGAQPGSLPVLLYGHGGDNGENLDQILQILPLILPGELEGFVVVVPSFRSERLTFDGTVHQSEGNPSPWDHDVDDALALLNVVAATTPAADMDRVGVLGFSRGACVGLLMAIRDARIDLVVEFFGPTDFFGPFVRQVTREALRGTLRPLPGLDYLNDTVIQPLKNGQITMNEARLEILRRSPAQFASMLPDVQVHHGIDDPTVPVGEAERLIEVMLLLGRGQPEFESYLYPGGVHDPLSLPGSLTRTLTFLDRLK